MDNQEIDVVRKHIEYFAKKDGTLDDASMRCPHYNQNIRSGVSTKISAIQSLLNRRGLKHNVDDLLTVINPESTGLWNSQGQFDNEVFETLKSKAIKTEDNKQILLRKHFDELRKDNLTKSDQGWSLASFAHYIIPVTWGMVTNGSLTELFKYYSDYEYTYDDGTKEPALTVEQVYKFYTNPNNLMEERALGKFLGPVH